MARMSYLPGFGILLTALLLGACGGPPHSPRHQIEAWVDAVEKAAEARDAGEVADHLADDYRDAHGNDRDKLKNLLRLYFLRERNVELVTDIKSIDLPYQDMAKIKLDVLIAGRHRGGSVLNIGAGRYRIEAELHRVDGEWLATWADWHRSEQ